jgi:hypothetical protein
MTTLHRLVWSLMACWMLSVTAVAAVPPMKPNNLVVDVKMEQSQRTTTRMRSSSGDFSKTDRNRRTLLVGLRRVGECNPDVTVYGFFIARDSGGKTSGFYGASVAAAVVKPAGGTVVEMESDDLVGSRERVFDLKFVGGDYPHGWVVLVYQKGTKIHEVGSTPDLLKWFWKNFPKRDVSKLK